MFALRRSGQPAEVVKGHLHPFERVKGCPPTTEDVVGVELTYLALDGAVLESADKRHVGDPVEDQVLVFTRLVEPNRLSAALGKDSPLTPGALSPGLCALCRSAGDQPEASLCTPLRVRLTKIG